MGLSSNGLLELININTNQHVAIKRLFWELRGFYEQRGFYDINNNSVECSLFTYPKNRFICNGSGTQPINWEVIARFGATLNFDLNSALNQASYYNFEVICLLDEVTLTMQETRGVRAQGSYTIRPENLLDEWNIENPSQQYSWIRPTYNNNFKVVRQAEWYLKQFENANSFVNTTLPHSIELIPDTPSFWCFGYGSLNDTLSGRVTIYDSLNNVIFQRQNQIAGNRMLISIFEEGHHGLLETWGGSNPEGTVELRIRAGRIPQHQSGFTEWYS